MGLFDSILKVLNENTGVTLILSALGFGFNEWYKTRNSKKLNDRKFKADNIDVISIKKEQELHSILSEFCLSEDDTEDYCIEIYEKIRHHIIENNLFLRDGLSKVGSDFADYVIANVAVNGKDLQKQEDLLKKFKNLFRN